MEMRNHAQIAVATDLDIYFCDPHSPWQRATNEDTVSVEVPGWVVSQAGVGTSGNSREY